jgi:cytochrome P450
MMDDPILIAAFAVAVSIFLSLCPRWTRRRLPFDESVPVAPDCHWILGHLPAIVDENFRHLMAWAKASANKNGQVRLWAFHKPLLFVFDIKDAKTVLNKESDRVRPFIVDHHVSMVNGKRGMLALNGKDWRLHRLAVSKTFNPDFLNGARKDMKAVSLSMVENIQRKISKQSGSLELDIEPLMKMVTLDIFGKTALGVDLKSCTSDDLLASPMANAFDYLTEQMMKRLRSPFKPQHFFYWIPTEQNRRQRKERHLLRSFLADLIEEKRKAQVDNPNAATAKDLLSHLLQAHHYVQSTGIVESGQVTDDNVTDIVMSLFVAGFDTTSITLACCLYMLAHNPQAQENCVLEIKNTKGDLVDTEDLVYCKAAIWEALRMFPPAVSTLRTLSKPMEISGGVVVPKGTDVVIPIYALHHDETLFAHPHEFRPDRWVSNEKQRWIERNASDNTGAIPAADRAAMMAFSGGGRNCVGMKFAQQEAVIALANLLNGLEFTPVVGFEMKTSTKSFLHKPVNGVRLNVSTRASVLKTRGLGDDDRLNAMKSGLIE